MNAHLLAARARGVPGIVRVPGGKTEFIKPVIDAGADGVIVPQVRSVEEVRQVIDDCRYPPLGRRGFGPRVPSNYFRNGGLDYVEQANQNLFVAVMIETIEAFEAIDAIVALPGLDSVVIGPSDLSWSLGTRGDFNDPKIVKAIETIVNKARSAGKFVGAGMGPDPDYALKMAQRGVQWMQIGMDCSILIKGWDGIVASFRDRWDNVKK